MQHVYAVAGPSQPVHRLTHLPYGAPFERERGRVHDRLVAVVEGVQTVLAVEVDAALGSAEDRNPPVPFVGVRDVVVDEGVEGRRWADRITRDDGYARDHL